MSASPLATINSLAFVAYSGARIVFDEYSVTGQPSTPAYPAIAQAGIKLVVCVRQPGEPVAPPPVPPPPPFDTNEQAELAALGVGYVNVPVTHAMSQTQFDAAATEAAVAYLNGFPSGPALIHCSTGDRASSVFAVLLILLGWTNADAVDACTNELLLANPTMIGLVNGYTVPSTLPAQTEASLAGASRLRGRLGPPR